MINSLTWLLSPHLYLQSHSSWLYPREAYTRVTWRLSSHSLKLPHAHSETFMHVVLSLSGTPFSHSTSLQPEESFTSFRPLLLSRSLRWFVWTSVCCPLYIHIKLSISSKLSLITFYFISFTLVYLFNDVNNFLRKENISLLDLTLSQLLV